VRIKELRGRSEPRLVCFDDFYRYYLGIKRRNKQAGLIYMSRETYEYFSAIAPVRVTKDMGKKFRKRNGLLNPSDMRKIAEQWMKSVFSKYPNLLEGDTAEPSWCSSNLEPKVSHRHYDNLRRKADKLYPFYLKYLERTVWSTIMAEAALETKELSKIPRSKKTTNHGKDK